MGRVRDMVMVAIWSWYLVFVISSVDLIHAVSWIHVSGCFYMQLRVAYKHIR